LNQYYLKDYKGRVYVYFGVQGVGIAQNASPDYIIQSSYYDVLFNVGMSLKVSDCNGDGKQDLIILSPLSQQGGDQRGHLAIFHEISSSRFLSNIISLEEDSQVKMQGFYNYGWFGFDAVCTEDQLLLVGSPGMRTKERG
jgi:hypothetical protein